jgi:predicted DNA-binding transcriptional regulator YafY
VLAALNGMRAALGDGTLGPALEKLMSMAPRGREGAAFEERLVVDLYPWGKREEERGMASAIERAIAEGRVLRFSYASYGRERDDRVVEPMTLVFKSYAWYLWGYCRKRGDFRLFKLARMRDLRSSLERFERRPGSYRELEPPSPAETVEVVLRFDPERAEGVQEWFASEDTVRTADGGIQVRMRVPPGDWMVNTFLGFGAGMEVVEPASLRSKLAQAAEKIMKRNDTGK